MAGRHIQAVPVERLQRGFATRIGVGFAELAAIEAHI